MVRIFIALIIVIAVIVAVVMVWARGNDTVNQDSGPYLLNFSGFAVDSVYEGESAEVDFGSFPGAEIFRTRIVEGVQNGPNYAGKYAVIEWGCGTSCQGHAIVDVTNGEIVAYGLPSALGAEYYATSTLLVINPPTRLPEPIPDYGREADYYEMRGGQLTFIAKQIDGAKEPAVCIQVITYAIDPATGEAKEFPTPCHVPYGWEHTTSTPSR